MVNEIDLENNFETFNVFVFHESKLPSLFPSQVDPDPKQCDRKSNRSLVGIGIAVAHGSVANPPFSMYSKSKR